MHSVGILSCVAAEGFVAKTQGIKLAEEQREIVRKLEEEIKVDPASHTTHELDQALAKLKELKARAQVDVSFEMAAEGAFNACPFGTYRREQDKECQKCPDFSTTVTRAANSPEQCVAAPGYQVLARPLSPTHSCLTHSL